MTREIFVRDAYDSPWSRVRPPSGAHCALVTQWSECGSYDASLLLHIVESFYFIVVLFSSPYCRESRYYLGDDSFVNSKEISREQSLSREKRRVYIYYFLSTYTQSVSSCNALIPVDLLLLITCWIIISFRLSKGK